ncbi:MAG: trypsin-like peptidase domain-containing protein [Planctomycetaceae bacterium]|jgi:serine protease Do|nr:trypsin-like peptidase domain-containing protein [Planctomycetaceae bacterium]
MVCIDYSEINNQSAVTMSHNRSAGVIPFKKIIGILVVVSLVAYGAIPVLTDFIPVYASESRSNWATKAYEQNCEAVVCIQGDKVDELNNSSKDSGKSYNGMGTGIIIDERGYIVTNFHVVEGIRKIQVTTFDRNVFTANLIARDTETDLAIIKINTRKPLKTITLGRSYDLIPGESCIAIGNPYGYAFSLTDGRISGIDREVDVNDSLVYRVAIQTNTEINPGNSGGPLINIDGEMIGINAAIRQGATGIAFAIPIDQVIDVAAKLLKEIAEQSISLGLNVYQEDNEDDSSSAPHGNRFKVVVESVENNSPAAEAGIEKGDIIKGIGQYPISNKLDFSRALIDLKSRDEVAFSILRNTKTLDLAVCMGTPQEDKFVQSASRSRNSSSPKSSSAGFAPKTATQVKSNPDDVVWNTLGFRYTPMLFEEYKRTFAKYLADRPHGGVVVKAVREGSLMAKTNIIPGDVIIAIHEYAITSQNDVRYVAKYWQTFKTSKGTIEIELFRDGQLYFTEIPLK